MFWDTKFSHPDCAGGVLVSDVLLSNSLVGKNEMGSQSRHPIRPLEERISQLKCIPIDVCLQRLGCCCSHQRPSEAEQL
jgi:hypothetical protein